MEKAGRPCKGEEGGVLYLLAASAGKQQGPGLDPGARTLRATYRERDSKEGRPPARAGRPRRRFLILIFTYQLSASESDHGSEGGAKLP